MAANELSVRLEGTQKSKANEYRDQLEQGNGFLGQYKCVDQYGKPNNIKDSKKCVAPNHIEYVTPGKLIADELTYSAIQPTKNLELADDLNSALAAIADATLNHYLSKLFDQGVSKLNASGNTQTFDLGSSFESQETGTSGTQFPDFYVTPGSWISNNPDFDISKDITQAFIDEQRTYISKLASYSDATNDLIKWIYQLDYCIPGPNPDWETTTSDIINNVAGARAKQRWWDTELGAQVNGVLDPGGIFTFIGNKIKDEDQRKAIAHYIEDILGVNVSDGQVQINDQGGIVGLLNNLLNSYRRIINETYFTIGKDYMPGVTIESRALFQKVSGYQQIVENNIEEIAFRQSIVTRLEGLKEKIDCFEDSLCTDTKSDPEDQQTITEFARLSAYFVDGDDIANIDTLQKETEEKTAYVRDDLVRGDYGCEADMTNLFKNPQTRSKYKRYAGRQPYPFKIDHLYQTVNSTSVNPYDIPYSPTIGDPNEGFLYGYIYHNNQGPYSDHINGVVVPGCPADRWLGVVTLTATGAKNGSTDPDLNIIPNDPTGKSICGVVLNFERNFGVY